MILHYPSLIQQLAKNTSFHFSFRQQNTALPLSLLHNQVLFHIVSDKAIHPIQAPYYFLDSSQHQFYAQIETNFTLYFLSEQLQKNQSQQNLFLWFHENIQKIFFLDHYSVRFISFSFDKHYKNLDLYSLSIHSFIPKTSSPESFPDTIYIQGSFSHSSS